MTSAILQEGAAAVAEAEGQSRDADGSSNLLPAGQEENLLQNTAISRLGTCLQVINQAHRGGEGLGPVPMRPILIRMLGPLLKVQVQYLIFDSTLQDLSLVCKVLTLSEMSRLRVSVLCWL